jgi:hypothetical protein
MCQEGLVQSAKREGVGGLDKPASGALELGIIQGKHGWKEG